MTNTIQVLSAAFAAVGFAIIFQIRFKHFTMIALGGALSWLSYLALMHYTNNDTISMFFASLIISLYSELAAKLKKAPSSIFYIPSIIPLIPGGYLYYFFSSYLQQDYTNSSIYASILLRQSLSIVLGAIVIYTIISLTRRKGYYQNESD